MNLALRVYTVAMNIVLVSTIGSLAYTVWLYRQSQGGY